MIRLLNGMHHLTNVEEARTIRAGLFFMANLVTLSTLLVAKNPQEAAIRLLGYYNESKPSQSTTYYGNVPNLSQRVVEDGNHPERLIANVNNDLTRIFSDHFNDVDFNSSIVDNGNGTYDVHITGTYSYEGVGYRLDENYIHTGDNT